MLMIVELRKVRKVLKVVISSIVEEEGWWCCVSGVCM